MSLDDIIKSKQKPGGKSGNFRERGGRGRGRGFNSGGPGPARRLPYREPMRTVPYMPPQPQVQQLVAVGGSGPEAGTKLYISNLDYGVSNEDIKDLFSEVGMLKRYSINYDRSGRSKGTAEVEYMCQADALAAIQRYNNVQLDGKAMKIELVGVNVISAVPMAPITGSILGKPNGGGFRRQDGILGRGGHRGSSVSVSRGRGSVRWGRGQGGKSEGEKISAESLDADLEKYRLEAMKIE